MKRLLIVFLATSTLFLCSQAQALLINYTLGSTFSENEKKVIAEAVREWAILLPCGDGMSISINIVCDNNLANLAETVINSWSGSGTGQGRPTSASITIDNDAHTWTMAENITDTDAMETLKHEIGHALGISIKSSDYMSHIKGYGSDTLYFDTNNDGNYNEADCDWRVWKAGQENHAFSSSDLMYYTDPGGYPRNRMHPTLKHAGVLGKSFGYCVVPIPSGLLLLGAGLARLIAYRRKHKG